MRQSTDENDFRIKSLLPYSESNEAAPLIGVVRDDPDDVRHGWKRVKPCPCFEISRTRRKEKCKETTRRMVSRDTRWNQISVTLAEKRKAFENFGREVPVAKLKPLQKVTPGQRKKEDDYLAKKARTKQEAASYISRRPWEPLASYPSPICLTFPTEKSLLQTTSCRASDDEGRGKGNRQRLSRYYMVGDDV